MLRPRRTLLRTAAALAGLHPLLQDFGRSNFQAEITLVDGRGLGQLLAALAALLAVGAALPAYRAARMDPVDILERR